jgi:hypothetical protein
MHWIYAFKKSITSATSLTNSRLDISNLLSTKKKPCCESKRAFLFSARAELAQARNKNEKTRYTPKADAGILTWPVIHRVSHRTKSTYA